MTHGSAETDTPKARNKGIIEPEVTHVYRQYNPNPEGIRVGDCAIRAVCKALDQDWERTHAGVSLYSFAMHDMPSANRVWGAYLRDHGFIRRSMPDDMPADYTVADFCAEHPKGCFVLAVDGHVICAKDGDWHDTWDSGAETPIYYYAKET